MINDTIVNFRRWMNVVEYSFNKKINRSGWSISNHVPKNINGKKYWGQINQKILNTFIGKIHKTKFRAASNPLALINVICCLLSYCQIHLLLLLLRLPPLFSIRNWLSNILTLSHSWIKEQVLRIWKGLNEWTSCEVTWSRGTDRP